MGDCDRETRSLLLCRLSRGPMYSNPPLHGAMLVKEILGEPGLKQRCGTLPSLSGPMRSLFLCLAARPALESERTARSVLWGSLRALGGYC